MKSKLSILIFLLPLLVSAQCDPPRPLTKRWIIGFGRGADIYNGLHLGFWAPGVSVNGLDLQILPRTANDIDTLYTQISGISIGAIGNATDRVNGLSLGSLYTINRKANGITFSSLFNVNYWQLNGWQLSLVNVGGSVNGIQSGIVNSNCMGSILQLGLCNVSCLHTTDKAMKNKTVQISLVNFSGDQQKDDQDAYRIIFQAGVVNAARRGRGIQVGLVNRARNFGGMQIGLLNFIPDNPRWCRVLPLVNFSKYKFPLTHRKMIGPMPLAEGASVVVEEDKKNGTRTETTYLGSRQYGLIRNYRNDILEFETYSIDYGDKKRWDYFLKNIYLNGQMKECLFIGEYANLVKCAYNVLDGDTFNYYCGGKKNGKWYSTLNDCENHYIYRNDTLISSVKIYRGKTLKYSDRYWGRLQLSYGDTLGVKDASGGFFSKEEGGIVYSRLETKGSREEKQVVLFKYFYPRDKAVYTLKGDSTIFFYPGTRDVFMIKQSEGEQTYFPNGKIEHDTWWKETNAGSVSYDKKGRMIYREQSDSLFRSTRNPKIHTDIIFDSVRLLPGDTTGNLYGNAFFRNGNTRATFHWKGKTFSKAVMFRKNGKMRCETFAEKKGIKVYFYRRNGSVRKVKSYVNYGPFKRFRPYFGNNKYFRSGICE